MKKHRLVSLLMVGILSTQVVITNALESFSDTTGHWGKATIEWAASQRIVKGYPDGTFKPNGKVTEAEFVTMLLNFYQEAPNGGNWPNNYYDVATKAKWPIYTKEIDRKTAVTRKHVAELIAAGNGTNYRGNEAIRYLLINNLAKGKGTEYTLAAFHGKSPMTRAEAAQFLKNLYDAGRREMKPVVPSPTLPPTNPPTPATLPLDPVSQLPLEELVDSVEMKGNILVGKIPQIPKGYNLSVSYHSKIPFTKPVSIKNKKPGETFTLTVGSEGGYLLIGFDVDNEGKSTAIVRLPEMKVEWGTD
ncbi:S-layer homology domain-containing protein [Brevibacillus parabrevis]|uniref:S-layer homology domain-containing protein n=1 Tax=Brevibacillus parabrevis TaxID=54914 RepID=UPI0023809524|nr:S-layer homology domain-containing protein [Brevibacillus parabrevis]WDV94878.1 S-layer homology domain-containing protein [Brevibacillus parabrevis]